MKKVSILTVIFITTFVGVAFSQHKFALNLGYDYMQKHTGYVGAEYRIDSNQQEHRSHGPFNIGIGTYLYGQNGKFTATPEIHLNKTWKHFIVTEISASARNIKPSIGLTFFNLARLQFGYSFPVKQSDFKGFSVGFHILIGKSPFYDEMRVF